MLNQMKAMLSRHLTSTAIAMIQPHIQIKVIWLFMYIICNDQSTIVACLANVAIYESVSSR